MSTTGQPLNPFGTESGYYCPMCDQQRGDSEIEMARDRANDIYSCNWGHRIPSQAMRMMGAKKKPFVTKEIPDPNLDIRPELWLRKAIWEPFSKKYTGRVWSTINSIMATILDDDFMFLTGDAVRKLHVAGVTNQEGILGLVTRNSELIAENETLQKTNSNVAALFANAAKSIGISDNSGEQG